MYEAFYGLKEKPFNLTPDPDYIYMSPAHENAFTHLEYALAENKGFVVITGEIGAGKTTLINFLLNRIPQDVHVGIINNTSVPTGQFIRMICEEFELKVKGQNKGEMLDRFQRFLVERFSKNKRVVLIIDEAQNLSVRTLEEIRMLSNLEAEKQHLIQIVLSGQPELRAKLKKKELEQLAQRVTVHSHLRGLDADEVARYISHRLRVAGADHRDLFTPEAIEALARYSKGIPRIINILCDAALVYGFADELQSIGKDVIEDVVNDKKEAGLFDPSRGHAPIAAKKQSLAASAAILQRLTAIEKRLILLTDVIRNYQEEESQNRETFQERLLELMEGLLSGDRNGAGGRPDPEADTMFGVTSSPDEPGQEKQGSGGHGKGLAKGLRRILRRQE